MFKSKPSKSGFIYKMIENVLRVFNGGKKGRVSNTKCGFFAQGVSCGLLVLWVILTLPLSLGLYVNAIAGLVFHVPEFIILPDIYTATLMTILITAPAAFIGLFAGLITAIIGLGCLVLMVVGAVLYTLAVVFTQDLLPFSDKGTEKFEKNVIKPLDRLRNILVQFKSKHCKKIEWED